ncbi:adenylate/guanylate cyclase domain-containing protein [Flagellimonas allohymeniacidonis]|uniref:Adenylate/guanylate cyclase domain-containing protein n=1 Tax=Flagellimonas allohymeniacidonis TaxID=2517819 RepID=A0A4Q8QCJ2_9FLAO|nr:adenylate/guanylate cyclase domain-containing protein [Allomuricauda hymeniacidonis]TAI48132.1 adenylate/guanylate cyclase domain-containing protein [Allomuricauda hymeniacidonis]
MRISIINKRRWRIVRFYCIGWTLAFIFLNIVRGIGTKELGSLQFDFEKGLIIAITLGPLMGLVSGFAQILVEERIYKRISIRKLLFVRFLFTILFTLILIVFAYNIYQFFFGTYLSIYSFAVDRGSGAIYFYVVSVDLMLAVLRQVNLMLGEGNLYKLIRGEFYTPNEEKRIFMFLDLQSSTELAERLGHVKYSMLVQDCFNDLGVAIPDNAEIYQYVGDEAVITWKFNEGIKNQECLKAFFSFKQLLSEKEKFYITNYGCVPFFKAGVHSGIVTVTEVGKYKKEIAYHGDTINTAARIQGKCNDLGSELLLSESLKNQLQSNNYGFTEMGAVALKGKKGKVTVHSVLELEIQKATA